MGLLKKHALLWLLLFGAALRTNALFAALDYDELWTIEYFALKPVSFIFTELALPNNQILNSLAVKAVWPLAGNGAFWLIRWHSFLAGVVSIWLIFTCAFALFRSRKAALWSAGLLALCAPAAAYAQLARGYELQLMFLLMVTAGLLWSGRLRSFLQWKYLPEFAVALGGAGAILALSTSVLFLGSITLSALILMKKKPGKAMTCVYIAGAVLALLWYGVNFQQFRAGQQWGTAVNTWNTFLPFAGNTLQELLPWSWGLFALAGAVFLPRKKTAALLLPVLLVLGSAVITKAGGPRVYLPLVALFALLGGRGIAAGVSRLPRSPRIWCGVFCAALAFWGYHGLLPKWTPPDWYALFQRGSSFKADTLVVYSAAAGYPVMQNNAPRSIEDQRKRLSFPEPQEFFSFTSPGMLNGADEHFSEKTLNLPVRGTQKKEGTLYRLRPVQIPAPGSAVVILSGPMEPKIESAIWNTLAPSGRYLRLNIHFESLENGLVYRIRGGVADHPEKAEWKSLPENFRIFELQ